MAVEAPTTITDDAQSVPAASGNTAAPVAGGSVYTDVNSSAENKSSTVSIDADSGDVDLRGEITQAMSTAPEATPEQLLDELVREHLDSVYRVAYSVVRDAALAEDVAQDAILKAWRALPTFRGDSSLRSWVLRITHNTAISTLRKRREELRDPSMLPEQETRSTTESEAVQHLSMEAFEGALDQLDELSRSIIVLREVEGLSYEEIAGLVGVPLPTVKTRLLRGRRVLASALSDWKQ